VRRRPRFSVFRIDVLAGVAAMVAAIVVLFVPSPVGLADNADYVRLLCHVPAAPNVARHGAPLLGYVNFTYHHGTLPGFRCDYTSSAFGPIWVAAQISSWLPQHHALDLHVVAVIYSLLFGVAVGVLVWALPGRWWVRMLGAAIAIVGLGDIAYTAYFASAYSEPFGLVLLVITVALLIRAWRARRLHPTILISATAAAILLVITKPQYAPLAVIIAAALLLTPPARTSGQGRWIAWAPKLLAAAVVLGMGWVALRWNPNQFTVPDRYNALFYELLGHSKNPQADLHALGLPTELGRYAGSNFYNPPNARPDPAFRSSFNNFDYPQLLNFYLHHPGRAWNLTERGLQAGADPIVSYLGNYPSDRGLPPFTRTCRLCIGSYVSRSLKPYAQFLWPAFWLLSAIAAAIALRQRNRDFRSLGGGIALTLGTTITLLATALLGGSYELVKHLYLVDAANTLLLVLVVFTVVELAVTTRRTRQVSIVVAPQPVESLTAP
jgi:hypothetical protein